MELKKVNEKKIFVTGVSGSGKTIFANEYSQKFNIQYIDFELNWRYKTSAEFTSEEDIYQKLIKKYCDEFITDAIPYTYTGDRLNFLDYYEQHKTDIKIICLCCTNKNEYDKRLSSKHFKSISQAYREFYDYYFKSVKNFYENMNTEFYDTSTNEYISKDELFKRIEWINVEDTKPLVKDFLKNHLDLQIYDKLYQDIECIDLIGYSNSSITWKNIKDLVIWKGKKVADLGCFHAYFTIKAAKAEAIATGLEINDLVIKTARYINEIEGNIISIKKWSGGDEVSSDYDIALCLNVLHHFPDIKKALENIKSKIVIFETNQELTDDISSEFNIIKKINSHRNDVHGNIRTILLCEKS